jgi:hypothetical protein
MTTQSHLSLTELPPNGDQAPLLLDVLDRQAQAFLSAWQSGHQDVAVLLRSHGLAAAAEPEQQVLGTASPERARTLVAREHGFRDWDDALENSNLRIDPHFEAAADAVVAGALDTLQALLESTPSLATHRSAYPHHSTLLHHCVANGSEHTRQWASPPNAPAICHALLAAGALPDATCNVYGGGSKTTPLCLLVSSSVPAAAGVQAPLVAELCRGGASIDGLDDDGLPLWTAITFGYTSAVDQLVASGARVDNLIFAAVASDIERVSAYLAMNGDARAAARSSRSIGIHGPALAPDRQLEYALICASRHGRREVVERLLSEAPNLSVTEPMWNSSALGMARHCREESEVRSEDKQAIIALLTEAPR